MADGSVNIDVKLEDSKAKSQASKTGKDISKNIENGMKGASSAAKNTESQIKSAMNGAASSSKSSFSDVGSAAKSSFSDVGDAANSAAGDASSAFQNIPSSASGSFSDVGSQAEAGFEEVSEAAETASEESVKSFDEVKESIGDMAKSSVPHANTIEDIFGVSIPASAAIAAAAIATVTAAVVKVASDAVTVGMEFDKSMSQVAATMGVTTDEIGELTEFAKEMGRTTAFSASQASEALNYMALAGYDAETSMSMLPTVLNLAAAGNMELATASDMVTDAQSALGLTIDETTEMVDKMAMASSKSNTNVEQLGNAFLTVGGTAKNLKGGTTELATALGILADNGIKGSEGGTALRNIILSLSAPVDKAADQLKALGISVFDTDGNMRSLNDIFKDLNDSMSTLTQEEKTKALNDIFNKVDLKSVNALLANTTTNLDSVALAVEATGVSLDGFGWSAENGEDAVRGMASTITRALTETNGDIEATVKLLQDEFKISTEDATTLVNAAADAAGEAGNRFDQLSGYIEDSAGAAQQMSDTQLDNLAGDVKLLDSAVEGLQLEISKMLTPALRIVTQIASGAIVPALTAIVPLIGNVAKAIAIFAAATVGVKAYNAIMTKTKTHTVQMGGYVNILGKEVRLTGTSFKVATVASKAFGKALNALKAAAPMLIITAVVEALMALKDAFDEAAEKERIYDQATNGLVEAFDELDESAVEAKDALNGIDTEPARKSFQELRSEIDANIEAQAELAGTIAESWGEINANETLLEGYIAVIDELTKKTDENGNAVALTTEEQAQFAAAVGGVNEITNSTIEVVDAENGVLSESTEQIKNNTKQWIENARAKAAQEQMVELQKQQLANEEALETATDNFTKAQQYKANAQAQGIALTAEENQMIADAESAYYDAKDAVDANAEAQSRLASKVSGADEALENSSKQISSYLKLRSDWKQAIGDMGINTDAFAQKLSDLGFKTSDLAKLSTDELKLLAGSYDSSAAEIIAVCDKLGIEVPDKLREAAQDGAEAIESTAPETEKAAEANAQAADKGYGSGNPKGVAKEGGGEYVDGIKSKEDAAKEAASDSAEAADEGYGSGNPGGVGSEGGGEYAQGVGSAQGQAEGAGSSVANASESGLKSKNDEADTWGSHLGQNFANGLAGAWKFVTDAASGIANAAASILGFSVPKDGIWSGAEKGGERSGRHLAENFARGMLSAKSEVEEAADELAETVSDSLSVDSSAWDSIVDTGEGLARGLVLGYEKVDPASQVVASMGAIMAMANSGSVTNNYIDRTQNNTFNNPVKSPEEWARYMNIIDRHGLAGKYG